jgi:uncharacterized protein (TIGR03790 family)
MIRRSIIAVLFAFTAVSAAATIDATTIAVLQNDADPDSRTIGQYYAAARRIPPAHVVHVGFPRKATLSEEEFHGIAQTVSEQLPASIQAIAVAWSEPYRVDCMSITSALTLGFDRRFCAPDCAFTRPNVLYASTTTMPYTQFDVRPAMLVAAGSVPATKAMIDRGIAASVGERDAVAYLVTSGDPSRDIRAYAFRALEASPPARVHIAPQQGFSPLNSHVMFYFTGAVRVPGIDAFLFEPGAIADHVTSAGAAFEQTEQMTAFDWLQAGATGSYGTVVEPCNFPEKFPNADIVVRRYAAGATLIEAYWSSVRMPGQGLFVGEPLARPFAAKPLVQ